MTDKQWLDLALPVGDNRPELQFYFSGEGDTLVTSDKSRMHIVKMPDKVKPHTPFFAMDPKTKRFLSKETYEETVNSRIEGTLTRAPNIRSVQKSVSTLGASVDTALLLDRGDGRTELFATGQVLSTQYVKDAFEGAREGTWALHSVVGDEDPKFLPVVLINTDLKRAVAIMPINEG